jgi:hypothetical protein
MSQEHPSAGVGAGSNVLDPSYTVDEFCRAERKSRSQVYKEWKAGIGPRFYWNGNTRRITHQARLDYHREREAAAATDNT